MRYKKPELISDEEVKERFPKMPNGLWYEIIDFSDKDYSSDWGFWGFLNRKHIYSSEGIYSRISKAGDAAREWKTEEINKRKKKNG